MRLPTLLACAGLLAAIIVTWARESRSQREIQQLKAALRAAGNAEVAAPGNRAPSPGDDVRSLVATVASIQAVAAAQPAPAAGAHQETELGGPASAEDQRRDILQAYRDEARDPNWSSDAEHNLMAGLRGSLPAGSHVVSVECHTTACMLQLSHASEEAAHPQSGPKSWLASLAGSWAGSGTIYVASEQQDGSAVVQTVMVLKSAGSPPGVLAAENR